MFRKNQKILFVIFLFLFTSSAYAQGEYLGKGFSTIGGFYGMVFDNGNVTRSYTVGGSIDGVMDLAIGIVPQRRNDKMFISSNIHIKNRQKGFNFALTASGLIDDYGYYTIGTVFHTNLFVRNQLVMKPFIGVGFIDISKDKDEDNMYLQFGVDLFLKTKSNSVFFVTPHAARINKETNFGLSFGILFSTN